MERGYEMSIYSSQNVIRATADRTGTLADRTAPLAGRGSTLADRAADPPSPAESVAHHLRLDDHRCSCGLPREECVRQRVRVLWTT
jgi:hypothetical protein